ncbi:MAG TPA: fumarate hydratase [Desulfonatronum sp.]|nr:fumarate hydratase [Desulfonatronum sp.]
MRIVKSADIVNRVADMVMRANRILPADVLTAIDQAKDRETSVSGRDILGQLQENAALARESGLPLCQDTGMAIFFVDMGEECRIDGMGLREAITQGMRRGYQEGLLRKSVCHPLTRKNTGDNSPAVIHMDMVAGDALKIAFMAKGGGSENMSRVTMLSPAQGWPGIKDFVVNRVAEAGPNPCPPTILGVGIGGSFELAPILAKKALLRPLDQPHPDPEIAAMEQELLAEVNELGIGPMGLGGDVTCLGVRINLAPCHIASLPLAVNVQCHSARHEEVEL